jgi:hypothetical protein
MLPVARVEFASDRKEKKKGLSDRYGKHFQPLLHLTGDEQSLSLQSTGSLHPSQPATVGSNPHRTSNPSRFPKWFQIVEFV